MKLSRVCIPFLLVGLIVNVVLAQSDTADRKVFQELGLEVQITPLGLKIVDVSKDSPLPEVGPVETIIYAVSYGNLEKIDATTVVQFHNHLTRYAKLELKTPFILHVRRGASFDVLETIEVSRLIGSQPEESQDPFGEFEKPDNDFGSDPDNAFGSPPDDIEMKESGSESAELKSQPESTMSERGTRSPRNLTIDRTRLNQNPSIQEEEDYAKVKVFFGTDRKLVDGRFSGARNLATQPLQFGWCEISIPQDHQLGNLESPGVMDMYTEDPSKHVVVLKIQQQHLGYMSRDINQILSKASKKSMLVFVHGFNVSFVDAARRSGQLHYDLQFEGVTSFFSWPSNASTSAYVADEADAAWAIPHFESFLEKICNETDVEDVYVLAHSMGNRIATRALVSLAQRKQHSKIKKFILAAPDVDVDIFNDRLAGPLTENYDSVTLYASSNDRALWASRQVHEVARAGEILGDRPSVKLRKGLDVIDVSVIDTSLLGHSYYGDRKSVLSDIWHLVKRGLAASKRNLIKINVGANLFFRFSIAGR